MRLLSRSTYALFGGGSLAWHGSLWGAVGYGLTQTAVAADEVRAEEQGAALRWPSWWLSAELGEDAVTASSSPVSSRRPRILDLRTTGR